MNASWNMFGYLWVSFGNLRKCSDDLWVPKPCSESSRRFCTKQQTSSISHHDAFVSSGFNLIIKPFQELLLSMKTILAVKEARKILSHYISNTLCLRIRNLPRGHQRYQDSFSWRCLLSSFYWPQGRGGTFYSSICCSRNVCTPEDNLSSLCVKSDDQKRGKSS